MKKRISWLLPALAACLWSASAWTQGQRAHQPEAKPAEDQARPEGPILMVLADYHAAMEARSVERLAAVVDQDLLVLEGVHANVGWADYRDNHIGPEMREWKEFKTAGATVLDAVVSGALAYAVEKATVTIVLADKTVILDAAETFVLRKGRDGWKIKHVHFSGKARPASPPAKQ